MALLPGATRLPPGGPLVEPPVGGEPLGGGFTPTQEPSSLICESCMPLTCSEALRVAVCCTVPRE